MLGSVTECSLTPFLLTPSVRGRRVLTKACGYRPLRRAGRCRQLPEAVASQACRLSHQGRSVRLCVESVVGLAADLPGRDAGATGSWGRLRIVVIAVVELRGPWLAG